MIVLDEQLLGRDLEELISAWYRGNVCFITDLRPDTIIKDDAIPMLLRQQSQPTFVTINERDFWRKVEIDNNFCVICFTFPDRRAREISSSLRAILKHPDFNTKTKRMAKVLRVTDNSVAYYSLENREILEIAL
ncbi:hypothetical protein NIES4071_67380 [Calothrix sp. NIES-4071]|nr:hypothetical protein NIES4071_67380 [Calothrix sp. NIES-4071]BAZ61016.1 hypothetical protein NIES4105_67340 [Calothrix sp. NIES-4105]